MLQRVDEAHGRAERRGLLERGRRGRHRELGPREHREAQVAASHRLQRCAELVDRELSGGA